MKLIVAIIQPEQLTAVQAALQHNVRLMTVSEVLDCGGSKGTAEFYRGREVRRPVTKLRLEITVPDASLDTTLGALQHASATVQFADVTVYVMGLGGAAQPRLGGADSLAMAR